MSAISAQSATIVTPEISINMDKKIEVRLNANTITVGDLSLCVRDETFEYLKTSEAKEIKVSTYLDQDWPLVQKNYAQLFVDEACFFSILEMTPGSKTRKVTLPGAMKSGEQLTIRVSRN